MYRLRKHALKAFGIFFALMAARQDHGPWRFKKRYRTYADLERGLFGNDHIWHQVGDRHLPHTSHTPRSWICAQDGSGSCHCMVKAVYTDGRWCLWKRGHHSRIHNSEPRRGLPLSIKQEIERQMRDDPAFTVRRMATLLQNRLNYAGPESKIRSFMTRLRNRNIVPVDTTLGQKLDKFRQLEQAAVPMYSPDDRIVIKHILREEGRMNIFLTTKRLIQIATESSSLHVDGTHLNKRKDDKVLTLIVRDGARRLHTCGLLLTSSENKQAHSDLRFLAATTSEELLQGHINPQYVIGDGLSYLSDVWPTSTRLMCFWHMSRVLQESLNAVEEPLFKADLNCLYRASSPEMFNLAEECLRSTWRRHPIMRVYETYRVGERRLWARGLRPDSNFFVSQTNNACESLNKNLKARKASDFTVEGLVTHFADYIQEESVRRNPTRVLQV